MGGVIAQALALAAPARVISLAFLCTFAGKDGSAITLLMLGTALRMRIGTSTATKRLSRADYARAVSPASRSPAPCRGAAAAVRSRPCRPAADRHEAVESDVEVRRRGAVERARDCPNARGFGRRGSHCRSFNRTGAGNGDSRVDTSRSPTPATACPSIAPPRPTRFSTSTGREPKGTCRRLRDSLARWTATSDPAATNAERGAPKCFAKHRPVEQRRRTANVARGVVQTRHRGCSTSCSLVRPSRWRMPPVMFGDELGFDPLARPLPGPQPSRSARSQLCRSATCRCRHHNRHGVPMMAHRNRQ